MGSLLIAFSLHETNYLYTTSTKVAMEGLPSIIRSQAKRDIPYKEEIVQAATMVCWVLQLTSVSGNELTFFLNFMMTVLIHCNKFVFGENANKDEMHFIIVAFSFIASMQCAVGVSVLTWVVFASLVQDQFN